MPHWFYINMGVEFKDVQDYDCRYNFMLIPSTHWAVRITELVPEADRPEMLHAGLCWREAD